MNSTRHYFWYLCSTVAKTNRYQVMVVVFSITVGPCRGLAGLFSPISGKPCDKDIYDGTKALDISVPALCATGAVLVHQILFAPSWLP